MLRLYYYKIKKKDFTKEKINSALPVLSSAEKEQAMSYKHKKDFLLYLAGKVMVRKIVSSFLSRPPKEIIFKVDNYGRPSVKRPKVKDFDFNISHSEECVVLVVSDKSVGIDIEKVRPIDINIAHDCFHDKELEYLFSDQGKRLERFYFLWTLKESFIKAIGKGLSYPLKSFYFKIGQTGDAKLYINNKKTNEWNFKSYTINNDYKVALCSNIGTLPKEVEHIFNFNQINY